MTTYSTVEELLKDTDLFISREKRISGDAFLDLVKGALTLTYAKNAHLLAERLAISRRQLQELVEEDRLPTSDEGYMYRRLTPIRSDIKASIT